MMENKPLVMGLDLSLTSTGIVILDQTGTIIKHAVVGADGDCKSRMEKLWNLLNRIKIETDLYNPEISKITEKLSLVVVEDYAYGIKQNSSLVDMVEIGTLVRFNLFLIGVPYITPSPTAVKKFVMGKGNAKKDEMRLGVYKRWGVEFPTTDEVDAYALAQIGRAYLGWEKNLTKYQEEIIVKMDRVEKIDKEKI